MNVITTKQLKDELIKALQKDATLPVIEILCTLLLNAKPYHEWISVSTFTTSESCYCWLYFGNEVACIGYFDAREEVFTDKHNRETVYNPLFVCPLDNPPFKFAAI